MARGGAHHALWLARGTRRVEDIGRVVALDRNAFRRLNTVLEAVPVVIAALFQMGDFLFALENHAEVRLVLRQFNRAIEQGLVVDHAAGLDPAGGCDDRLGFCIIDPNRQFVRGKAAEHD